jgi:hypothetical protein
MSPDPYPRVQLATAISDAAAAQLVEVLRELTDLLESQYYGQIRRHYQADHHNRQTENWDDHNPPF